MPSKKRCVCGLAKSFPICDGSHSTTSWNCKFKKTLTVEKCFIAGGYYLNLAEKLAHRFSGISAHQQKGPVKTQQAIYITDGHDLPELLIETERIETGKTIVIGVGLPQSVLTKAFKNADIHCVPDFPLGSLWIYVEKICEGGIPPDDLTVAKSIFLSHATADEPNLFPAVAFLRKHLGLNIFVCADSIALGSSWLPTIRQQIKDKDIFLYIASNASNRSTFCAFECGFAMAIKKPFRIISLDGTPPPAHLQDIQALEVPRIRKRKPWLQDFESIVEAFLLSSQ